MKLRRILRQLCRLRAAPHCFAAQSPTRFALLPRKRGSMRAVEPAEFLATLGFTIQKATRKGWLFVWWS